MTTARALDALVQRLDPLAGFTAMGMQPDPWQAALLSDTRVVGDPGGLGCRVLVCTCRQAAKSTTAAALAANTARGGAGRTILCLAPTLRQATETLAKVREFLIAVGEYPVDKAAQTITLRNGSRIVAVPGDEPAGLRGYSAVSLIILDEASYAQDNLLYAVLPMLNVSAGGLVMISTPAGPTGAFWRAFEGGGAQPDPMWTRYRVTADECPRISTEVIESAAETMQGRGSVAFRRDYMAEFVAASGAALNADALAAAADRPVLDVDVDLSWDAGGDDW